MIYYLVSISPIYEANMEKLSKTDEWCALSGHFEHVNNFSLRNLFEQDTTRFDKFSVNAVGLLYDFSKNHLQEQTLDLLIKLANKRQLADKIQQLFAGSLQNATENRYVFHPALRKSTLSAIYLAGQDISQELASAKAGYGKFL